MLTNNTGATNQRNQFAFSVYLVWMKKVLLFNPWSARYGFRIPNSILQIASSIHGKYDYTIVDGNRETDAWDAVFSRLQTQQFRYFGCTVMPGHQLKQAIPFTRKIKELFPDIKTIWGGYFASNHYQTCIESGYIDYIVNGPGDETFPALIEALEHNRPLSEVPNLVYMENGSIVQTRKAALIDQDLLPDLPYRTLDEMYPLKGYLKKTFLGNRTAAYHSSIGCPFTCSFCAVVPIYNARWKGKSAQKIYKDLMYLIDHYQADAVEFHDNNFFVSEKRTVEFSKLIKPSKINWWGEGRIDTLNHYSDISLNEMREAGCRMIFFGAETGNAEILRQMDKGGTQTAENILSFAGRIRRFGIIPEYSFVLGMPGPDEETVANQIDQDIKFIREIKKINPETEIIIYIYAPVPVTGSELFDKVTAEGFSFPKNLEDWLSENWLSFDLRRNPHTPWLNKYMVDKIHGFETVLNACFPTITDFKLSPFKRKMIRALGMWRYKTRFFLYPYELNLAQRYWLRYRRPETEGFAMN